MFKIYPKSCSKYTPNVCSNYTQYATNCLYVPLWRKFLLVFYTFLTAQTIPQIWGLEWVREIGVWNASVLTGSKKYPNFPDPFQTPNLGYVLGFQTPNLGYVLGFHTPKFGVWFRRSKRYRRPTKTSFKVVRINNFWHIVYNWNTFGVYFEQDLGYILNKILGIFWTRFGVYYNNNSGIL